MSDAVTVEAQKTRPVGRIGSRIAEWLLVAGLLASVIVALQMVSGAYRGEFSDDEASHYISGLFLKEFLHSGYLGSPLSYLKEFHSRYPLIGIGHWGPLFYGVEALWMMIFSQSKLSVILLSGTVTLAIALLLYGILAERLSRLEALLWALAFILFPMVQVGSGELMLDAPVALFCFLSMLSFLRFLDTGHLLWSALFGVMAAAALLIKGNAACLALLPPLAIVFGRRWDLIGNWKLWIAAAIVLVGAGPWYVFTYGMVEQGFRYSWSLHYILTATEANATYLYKNAGLLMLALAAIGIVQIILRAKPSLDSLLIVAAALFFSVWIFQSIVPAAIQDRYLMPALPAMVICAAYGLRASGAMLASRLSLGKLHRALVVGGLVLAIAAPLAVRGLGAQTKPQFGFAAAAGDVWTRVHPANRSALIVANSWGEAASIAELAMIDPKPPSLFAVRGSRIFGGGGYNSQDYEPRFDNVEDVMTAIDEYAIPFLIFQKDNSKGAWGHIRQVEALFTLHPDRWRLVARNGDVSVFEILGNESRQLPTQKMMLLTGPKALAQP